MFNLWWGTKMIYTVQPKNRNNSKNKTKNLKRPQNRQSEQGKKREQKLTMLEKEDIITGALEITKMRAWHAQLMQINLKS